MFGSCKTATGFEFVWSTVVPGREVFHADDGLNHITDVIEQEDVHVGLIAVHMEVTSDCVGTVLSLRDVVWAD